MQIYGFDTEATPFNYFMEPELILWACSNDDQGHFGTTTKDFMTFLLSRTESSVIVSFNLGFDWYMVFKNLDLTKYFDRVDINVDGVPPHRAVLSRKVDQKTRITLVFLDLANFTGRHKLEKLAIEWEVQPKLDSGTVWEFCFEQRFQTPPQNLMIYCLNDADIVYRIYKDNFFYLMEGAVLSRHSRVLRSTNSRFFPGGTRLHVHNGLKIGSVMRISAQLCGYVLILEKHPIKRKSMILTLLILGRCEDSKFPLSLQKSLRESLIGKSGCGLNVL